MKCFKYWKHLLAIFTFSYAFSANALVISDTISLGVIGDTDTDPGVPFIFNVGKTFSSISSLQFTFDPCELGVGACTNTIGSGEDVVLELGPDNFQLSNVGSGATIITALIYSPALAADMLDGVISGKIWLHEKAGYDFAAGISSADISLQVDGVEGYASEPASLTLLGLGLAGLGFSRKRRAVKSRHPHQPCSIS